MSPEPKNSFSQMHTIPKVKKDILRAEGIDEKDACDYFLFSINDKDGHVFSSFILPKTTQLVQLKQLLCEQFRSDLRGLDVILEDSTKAIKFYIDQLEPTQTLEHTNINEPIYINIRPTIE